MCQVSRVRLQVWAHNAVGSSEPCSEIMVFRGEVRCVAVLFGSTFVMSVCAFDSGKGLEDYGRRVWKM